MSTKWAIKTHGDPLGTVQQFVRTVWYQARLDGMLVLINGNEDSLSAPRLINEPHQLDEVNPFKPLMTMNAARLVPGLISDYPGARLGVMLRPCEMRALIEMVKHDCFTIDDLLTICVDCLGTYSADEYQWRAARKRTPGGLGQETLQFARQGGISAYRYRSACQFCRSPKATGADLNINVLGLPIRQQILVTASDEAVAERLRLDTITDGVAGADLIEQHKRVLAKLTERHQRTMERVEESLGKVMPRDLDEVIAQLDNCGSCQKCMNVCPICAVDFPKRGKDGHYQRETVMRWLVSCAGCGMCEQSCSNHLPLSAIFSHIREILAEEYGYLAGNSLEEPLPI